MQREKISFVLFVLIFVCWLRYNFQHVLFQGFFFEVQSVFVPNEFGGLSVDVVAGHAVVKQTVDVVVVWVASEGQLSAIHHEVLEFVGLVETQLV